MATSAFGAQAVGIAAAQCSRKNILPEVILNENELNELQQALNIAGQSIPRLPIDQKYNLATKANIQTSTTLVLDEIPFDGSWYKLDFSVAQMLPLSPVVNYNFEIELDVQKQTTCDVELRYSEKPDNYTPDCIAEKLTFSLHSGEQRLNIPFSSSVPNEQYAFITF